MDMLWVCPDSDAFVCQRGQGQATDGLACVVNQNNYAVSRQNVTSSVGSQ